MSIYAQASGLFNATAGGAPTGLVGVMTVEVLRLNGDPVIGPTTLDIIELVAGSGTYAFTGTAPSVPGEYEVVWSTSGDSPAFANEDLIVTADMPSAPPTGDAPYPTIATVAEQAQQFQRAVRGQRFTAAYTFGLDSDALPDTDTTVTCSIVDAAGYLVVDNATASLGSVSDGQQTATVGVGASSTPQRDRFTCIWTVTLSGVATTLVSIVDIVDRRLFPTYDYSQFAELAGFSATQLENARRLAEDFLNDACGTAFTGSYDTETYVLDVGSRSWSTWGTKGGPGHGYGYTMVPLAHPFVQAVRSVTLVHADGSTYPLNLEHVRLDSGASILYYRHLDHGLHGTLVIALEHGRPVADARRVCLILARYRLLNGPLESRATSMVVEGGGTIQLLTPGVRGSVTGIPEVDAFVMRNNRRAVGFIGGL